MPWGRVTPYGNLQIAPSFAFTNAPDVFSMKASMGSQLDIHALAGLKLWFEFGLGIENSVHNLAFGVSYPFEALQG